MVHFSTDFSFVFCTYIILGWRCHGGRLRTGYRTFTYDLLTCHFEQFYVYWKQAIHIHTREHKMKKGTLFYTVNCSSLI